MLEQVSSHIYQFDYDSEHQILAQNGHNNQIKGNCRAAENQSNNHDMLSSYRRETTKSGKSRKESVKNSTARYREKKKKQLQQLESTVKNLQEELESTELQVEKVKESILKALEEKAKGNQLSSSHQNVEILSELEAILARKPQTEHNINAGLQILHQDIDIDKINLLLDTLKYRIGASGRERQAKINYNFKNIINTLFPALYRYVLSTAVNGTDLFSMQKKYNKNWTEELLCKLNISQKQRQQLEQYQPKLQKFFSEIKEGIAKLNYVKQKLREETLQVEKVQEKYREDIDPIQCAHWTLFSQRYKYRQQIALDHSFAEQRLPFSGYNQIQRAKPCKKIKKQILDKTKP